MIDRTSDFEKIYEATYDDVLKVIICHCSNMEDVNEIVQETYLSFYRALKQRKEIENDLSYLIGIAKNKVKKHYSLLYRIKQISLSSSVKDEIELEDVLFDETDLEQDVMRHLEAEEVWKHLKKKQIQIQKVFMMHYYFEMTLKEIADLLQIPESTVKTYLYRTLKELRKELIEHVYER